MTTFYTFCCESLGKIRAQQRYRTLTPLRKQADRFPVCRDRDGRDVLVWSSNDYLAMGGHPVVVEAACAAARTMGAGAGGTRNITAAPARCTTRWKPNSPP
jgi:5-aminolevulinate synthase